MCTAFYSRKNGHFFGRNLDLDCSYEEKVIFAPRNYPFLFRQMPAMQTHYAILGMGLKAPDWPLFYDGFNEKGLCMAGLNFPGNAFYHPLREDKANVGPFELIPWVLGQCESVQEAKALLERTNVADFSYHAKLPNSPLHFLISDEDGSLVVESERDGLHIYDAAVEVLTNNPPYPHHLTHLASFRGIGAATPANTLTPGIELPVYCQGLGGLGLPGDVSSMSRFVRAAFHLYNSRWEKDPMGQVFRILDSVQMLRGACKTDAGTWDETVYSACMDLDGLTYSYVTYDNRRISQIHMKKEKISGTELVIYPLQLKQDIWQQNDSHA